MFIRALASLRHNVLLDLGKQLWPFSVIYHSTVSQSQIQSAFFFSSGDEAKLDPLNETKTEAGDASVNMLSSKTVTGVIS